MNAPTAWRTVGPTTVRRLPEKQLRDRSALDAVLDAALVGHVGFTDPGSGPLAGAGAGKGRPLVVPMGLARDRDEVLVHGSAASRAMRALAAGVPACLTVTRLDGIVVARSQFESSMQYRCAMVFGTFEVLQGRAKAAALDVLVRRLLPGIAGQREPSRSELAATAVLALPIVDAAPGRPDAWSVKVSADGPDDAPADRELPVWAGVVPLRSTWGVPVPADDLPPGLDVPAALTTWPEGRA